MNWFKTIYRIILFCTLYGLFKFTDFYFGDNSWLGFVFGAIVITIVIILLSLWEKYVYLKK